jgi:uncharacterized protein (TIGR02117 family)
LLLPFVYLRKLISSVVVLLLVCALPGCATGGDCLDDATPPELVRTIYIVKRGGHTGVAIAAADWPNRNWSLLADFPNSDYLEFGWGDERFYQAEPETLWLGTRAALWPTSSVIHVIGFRSPLAENIRAEDIVEVRVSVDGLRRMAEAIELEFSESTPTATPVSLRAAPKPNHFYSAKGKFFFPRMCNWWIASRLAEASCPIQPWSVVTARRIMREARGFNSDAKR